MSKDNMNSNSMSPVDRRRLLYDRLRSQIEHEDDLVNHRINWLLLSQGFLFVAYGTLLPTDKILEHKTIVLCIIGSIGFLICIITFNSVLAAFRSLKSLRDSWNDKNVYDDCDKAKEDVWLAEGFPQITWVGTFVVNATSAATLPLLIMLAWSCLVGAVLYKAPIPHPVVCSCFIIVGALIWVLYLWGSLLKSFTRDSPVVDAQVTSMTEANPVVPK